MNEQQILDDFILSHYKKTQGYLPNELTISEPFAIKLKLIGLGKKLKIHADHPNKLGYRNTLLITDQKQQENIKLVTKNGEVAQRHAFFR